MDIYYYYWDRIFIQLDILGILLQVNYLQIIYLHHFQLISSVYSVQTLFILISFLTFQVFVQNFLNYQHIMAIVCFIFRRQRDGKCFNIFFYHRLICNFLFWVNLDGFCLCLIESYVLYGFSLKYQIYHYNDLNLSKVIIKNILNFFFSFSMAFSLFLTTAIYSI